MRLILVAALCVPLLSSLLVSPLAAAPRPKPTDLLERELARVKDAICAKADADNDSYRPYVCPPRCDCLPDSFLQSASSCQQTQPGVFAIEAVLPGQCDTNAKICLNSGAGTGLPCNFSSVTCPQGETCVGGCAFGICVGTCRRPCGADADCGVLQFATLAGVTQADRPDVVLCTLQQPLAPPADPQKINTNDALECLARVQAAAGTCQ